MEGQDVQHLQYGTSSAKTTTLSFYVRSNKTETYTVWFYRPDGSRMNAVNFSVSAANTWEKKVITIVGDTTSAIADDNTMGYKFEWVLAAGPDYTSGSALNGTWGALNSANRYVGNTGTFGQSTSDYFDLTGVQYEVGSQATEFEHRSFGEERELCRRYYHAIIGKMGSWGSAVAYSTSDAQGWYSIHPEMRAAPTFTWTGTLKLEDGASGKTTSNTTASTTMGTHGFSWWTGGFSGLTDNYVYYVYESGQTGYFQLDAEL